MVTGKVRTSRNMLSRGASDVAKYVTHKRDQTRRRLQESYTLGLIGKGVFSELDMVFRDSSENGWDGNGAPRVEFGSYDNTRRFLESLPFETSPPSITADADGQITLEWYRTPRRTLSLSFSPDGDIHFAALIGTSRVFGTEHFYGYSPERIIDLIQDVIGAK